MQTQTSQIPNLLFWATCFFFVACAAHAQSPQEVARRAFGSTVLLVMEDANGQPVSLGSGFFIKSGEIATNLHVVKGSTRGYARLISQPSKFQIEGITATDSKRDLVVLKVSDTRTPALTLGQSDAVQVGDSVYAVGNPQGLEGTFSQGIISAIRDLKEDKLLQITAPISPGSSGGPVLNHKGEVVGVSVATYKNGQNLNFAIPSDYLKALAARSGAITPLSSTARVDSQKSILSNLGGKSTEGVAGENFTFDSDNIPDGNYSFSIANKLRESIRDVRCLIIFYDLQGRPIDISTARYSELIHGGLAKRVKGRVDETVEKINNPTPAFPYVPNAPRRPKGRIDIRILDFRIAE